MRELESFHKIVVQELDNLEKRTQFLSSLEKETVVCTLFSFCLVSVHWINVSTSDSCWEHHFRNFGLNNPTNWTVNSTLFAIVKYRGIYLLAVSVQWNTTLNFFLSHIFFLWHGFNGLLFLVYLVLYLPLLRVTSSGMGWRKQLSSLLTLSLSLDHQTFIVWP